MWWLFLVGGERKKNMRLLHTVEFGPLKGFKEAVRLSEKKHWWGLFLCAETTAHVLLFFTFYSFKEL
ncbi:hypothetical protein YC2023_031227 [Brassica napus]